MHKTGSVEVSMDKPVLFPCVISACIGLADLGGKNPHDIHKQDEVKLRERERKQREWTE